MTWLEGRCLLASPHLEDPNFYHTALLMVAHSPHGAMGLVLNRPTDTRVKQVLEPLTKEPCLYEDFLYRGGPVDGPLVALHGLISLSERECLMGVHFTTNGKNIQRLANLSDIAVRFFDGFAGWGPGQLEEELEHGGWIVTELTADLVFGPSEPLWGSLVHRVGRDILSHGLGDLPFSDEPRNN